MNDNAHISFEKQLMQLSMQKSAMQSILNNSLYKDWSKESYEQVTLSTDLSDIINLRLD
jgi:hypothetical protein